METRKRVRDILIGKNNFLESRFEYKSALLRGYMALIALAVGVLYTIIDYFSDLTTSYPFYISIIILAIVTILLNRRKKFTLASVVFLLTNNAVIFLFAIDGTTWSGAYMFFICGSLSAFALFGHRHIRYAFMFSGLSLCLFLIAYWRIDSLTVSREISEMYVRINFTTNFITTLVTCILIVYFLIDINFRSERELLTTAEELQKSRERNEMVIEAAKAGIYEWRRNDQRIYVSATWKELLGYEDFELEDFSIDFYFSLVHPDLVENTKAFLEDHLQSKKPYALEMLLRKKDGGYNWFIDNGYTKFDDDGNPIVTVGSLIDIHERKLAEDKIIKQNTLLAKANAELDSFVYSVSHDLRAPLSSILGLTNVYTLSSNTEEKESIIKLISDRANTLDAFIREILDYSRNSRRTLKIQMVNVQKLIEEVVDELSYMKGFKRLKIQIDMDSALEVSTDRDRLKVVLNNLVANAVKYSDYGKDSFLRINSSASAEQWSISLQDNGIGIKQEHHEKVFNMFYQAHDHSQGSGLGLYIVKETVERMQGEIRMNSAHGYGTTFSLIMPVRPVLNEPIQELESPE